MSLERIRKLEEELKKIEESYKFYSPIYADRHIATYHPQGKGLRDVIEIHESLVSSGTLVELGKWASKQMKRSVK